MLDLKFIRENAEFVKINTSNKNATEHVDLIISHDERRREIIQEVEKLKSQRNLVTKEIADLKKAGKDASEKIFAMKGVSDQIKELDDELGEVEDVVKLYIMQIPNMTHSSVPIGKNADDNLDVRQWGEVKKVNHKLNHIEIATKLGIVDFERGAKVAGGGFHFYTAKGARLERALINFFLDTHTDIHGYTEMMPPFVANRNSMRGTGQLPKMAEDMYHCQEDDLFLIPTAEVPLTNYHNGEILKAEELNKRICGYSPCFRREAGSYGKDVRGLLRVHQFNKVELVKFVKPEDAFDELESLVNDAEALLRSLDLHYRVILLCTGDTSFASAKTYDIEVWSPGEEKWLEVSSCSNFGDFQARRANIRFKRDANAKPEFLHTLNGSGLATPRIMVAIIENYFDGEKLHIPKVLQKYVGCEFIA
jgi:seryl-tRNA synthetase